MLEPPEWVHIWYWLRFGRDPQVMTALPQQEFVAPKPAPMTVELYDTYRAEWLKIGAPKARTRQVLEAMGVNPILAVDDGIPF